MNPQEPITLTNTVDAFAEATRVAFDAGLRLADVIVLAYQEHLELNSESPIDDKLTALLVRIAAERVRIDLGRRPKPRARRTRLPRVALQIPLERPNNSEATL